MAEEKDFQTEVRERFAKLPKAVQNAIQSGDPEKRLRELSRQHQLHLDQWQALENVVMFTLLGVFSSADLEKHIRDDVGVPTDATRALAEDIVKAVFEPVRDELERELTHPEAKDRIQSNVEKLRDTTLGTETSEHRMSPGEPSNIPAPQVIPPKKVERAAVSPVYKPRESSLERKNVEGDPYREPPQ